MPAPPGSGSRPPSKPGAGRVVNAGAAALKFPIVAPTALDISDGELATVARVAGREAWSDLASPPQAHGPRTLDEERAVARFTAAAAPRRAGRGGWMTPLRARIMVAAMTAAVLGACWIVSPTRTAIGLFGAGLFSLIAFRRRSD